MGAMPKMKRNGSDLERVPAMSVLSQRSYEPMERLLEMLGEVVEVDGAEEKAGVGAYKDWEAAPGGGLRVRASVRLATVVKLLEYVHPKMKETADRNVGVVVEVKNYVEGSRKLLEASEAPEVVIVERGGKDALNGNVE